MQNYQSFVIARVKPVTYKAIKELLKTYLSYFRVNSYINYSTLRDLTLTLSLERKHYTAASMSFILSDAHDQLYK